MKRTQGAFFLKKWIVWKIFLQRWDQQIKYTKKKEIAAAALTFDATPTCNHQDEE
jgi:hypothetical protein